MYTFRKKSRSGLLLHIVFAKSFFIGDILIKSEGTCGALNLALVSTISLPSVLITISETIGLD